MRTIKAEKITRTLEELVKTANFSLRPDVRRALNQALSVETSPRAKNILKAILDNADYAAKQKLAICQDTGMPVVFARIGQELRIAGDLRAAVNKGIVSGYKKYCLRNSIVPDPLTRGKPGYFPCILHVELAAGSRLELVVLPKGFGCENKSRLKMFKPTASLQEIKDFIVETVKDAGADACPPYVVGVGIGGTADYAAILAKKALLAKLNLRPGALEKDLLARINKTGIGPMGLGGKTTALGVKVLSYPTHIAGLPVSVNISCHALRRAAKII